MKGTQQVYFIRYGNIVNTHLKDLTRLECGTRQQNDWTGNVAGFNAQHIWIFVVTEIGNLARLIRPWIPDHCSQNEYKIKFLLSTHAC